MTVKYNEICGCGFDDSVSNDSFGVYAYREFGDT